MRNNKQGNKLKYNKKTFNRKAGHLHEIILLPKQKQKNWRETDAYAQSRLITAVTPMVEICYAHAQTKCPSAAQTSLKPGDYSSQKMDHRNLAQKELACGYAVVWWLARWTSDLNVGSSRPSPCHRVVSLDKKLYPTLSLSTQVCQWVPRTFPGNVLVGLLFDNCSSFHISQIILQSNAYSRVTC